MDCNTYVIKIHGQSVRLINIEEHNKMKNKYIFKKNVVFYLMLLLINLYSTVNIKSK